MLIGAALLGGLACLTLAPALVLTSAQAGVVVLAADEAASDGAGTDAPAADPAGADAAAGETPTDAADAAEPTPSPSTSDDAQDAAGDTPADDPSDDPSDPATDDATDDPADAVDDPADATTDEPSVAPTEPPVTAASDGPATDAPVESKGLALALDGAIGQPADSATISAQGSGLAPGSRYELWAFSTPTLVTTGTADESGSFTISAALPSGLEPGTHSLLLRGTGADGQPVETATGFTIAADGTLGSIGDPVDPASLNAPQLPASAMAPPYAPVVALDNPAAVVTTAIAGLAAASALGAAAAGRGSSSSSSPGSSGAAGGDDPAGGGINEGGAKGVDDLADVDRDHEQSWRRPFTAQGTAWGDHSALHRLPFTPMVDEAFRRVPLAVAAVSPVLGRMAGDGAPLRAMVGGGSILLPIAGLLVGTLAAINGDGIAQPPALGFLAALMAIGILDAVGGLLAATAFTLVIAVSGGIISWESVRTLLGVALLIVGPGLIGSAFRGIRRQAGTGGWYAWERLTDIVIVPLFAAYVAYNIASSLPPLGGSAFPIGDQAMTVGLIVLVTMVLKVLLEEVAARWFPERLASVLPREVPEPGVAQQLGSSVLRTAVFLFISAAFVGNVWQLWVAGVLFLVPSLVEPFADRFPNAPGIWRAVPEGLSLFALILLVSLVISNALSSSLSDGATFARMAFVILLIPDVVLGLLGAFGREGSPGEVRWYLRPNRVLAYRLGGVMVLMLTAWLVYKTTAG